MRSPALLLLTAAGLLAAFAPVAAGEEPAPTTAAAESRTEGPFRVYAAGDTFLQMPLLARGDARLFVPADDGGFRVYQGESLDLILRSHPKLESRDAVQAIVKAMARGSTQTPAYAPWHFTVRAGAAHLERWRGNGSTWLFLRDDQGLRALSGPSLDAIRAADAAARDNADVGALAELDARLGDRLRWRTDTEAEDPARHAVLHLEATTAGLAVAIQPIAAGVEPRVRAAEGRDLEEIERKCPELASYGAAWFERAPGGSSDVLESPLAGFTLAMVKTPEATSVMEVTAVTPDGAAARAGLKRGDRLISINGRAPDTLEDARRLLHDGGEGPPAGATLRVMRGDEELSLTLVLASSKHQ